ncbi:MAG: phosphopantetheine-binding protein [Chloroflexota bacterium]|nr:phosphopantetheine-binding protein [Chloroflexota bacterium]
MQASEILQQLKMYITEQVLDGKDAGLDETTPLLEWGILNSFETIRLVVFIQNRFSVKVPSDKLLDASYFANLPGLINLVLESPADDLVKR